MYDLIIVGAGPAGLTSALYALRANKKVLMLEAVCYGGQIVNANKVENYPGIEEISGYELATKMYNQVKKLGVEIKYEKVIMIDENKIVHTQNNEYQSKAIIIATGVKKRKLNVANEEKFVGKGLSYCATCDGNFYKGKEVAVNGGGNTALEDALYLANLASKVYLIHRRETFKGEEKYVKELHQKKNVEFVLNSSINSLNGDEELEYIEVIDKNQNIKRINVAALFVAIGQVPDNDIFQNVVEIDENGYIKTSDGVHTKTKGIYIAGDCKKKELRQLTTAVSDGSIAATVAIKEMREI